MESQNNEHSKYTNEQSLKAMIGLMSRCGGYDEQTRLEYIEELIELMEAI